MDLDKLTTSDKVIAGGAIVLFLAQFFPWFEVSVSGFGSATGNGFDIGFLWGTFPMLLGLVMLAHVAITAFSPDTKLPDLPATWGQVHLGLGGLAAFLVVLKLLIGEDADGAAAFGVDVTRSFGIFLAAAAAIALAVGGYLKFQEERSGTAGGPAAPGTPPPPPPVQ